MLTKSGWDYEMEGGTIQDVQINITYSRCRAKKSNGKITAGRVIHVCIEQAGSKK